MVAPVAPKAARVSPGGMEVARPETRVSTTDCAPGERKPQTSAAAAELLTGRIVQGSPLSRREIADRLVEEMAAEGEAILAEGIARTPSDIDLVKIHGYGFPRWRGGPMFATDRRSG